MKFIASAGLLAMAAVAAASQLEKRQAPSGETVAEVLGDLVGGQVYSDLVQGAAPSVISALDAPAAGLPTLISQLVAGTVPTAFAQVPADIIAVAEQIASDIAALPTDVVNFVEANPSLAAPIISAIENGVPPPAAAISAIPNSLTSELIPIFQSIYGTQAVATYLAALTASTPVTGVVTATASVSGSKTTTTVTTSSMATTTTATASTSAATASTTSKNVGGNVVVAGGWLAGLIGSLGMLLAL